MTDTTMEQRLTQVRARIEQCCHAAGRHPDEVQLLPVSKTFADELIVQAQSLGLLRFGENRAQDLRARFESFSQTDIQWVIDRKSTRLNSSHVANSYADFCLKKKKKRKRY